MRKNMFLKRPFQKSHDINEKLFNVDTNDGLKNISISSAYFNEQYSNIVT